MTKPLDPIALKIGAAYKRGLAAYVEAGRLLIAKKKAVPRGKWGSWLKANRSALGFGERAANYLMSAARANPQLTADTPMPAAQEQALTNKLWGNDKRTPTADDDDGEPDDDMSGRYLFAPTDIIARGKRVMGGIELDTSSCKEANDLYVKAERFFDKAMDGLKQEWVAESLWLNPMYDNMSPFVDKLIHHYTCGDVRQAMTLTNDDRDRAWFKKLKARASAVCITWDRVKFHAPGGKTGKPARIGNAICYFGPDVAKFWLEFHDIGLIWIAPDYQHSYATMLLNVALLEIVEKNAKHQGADTAL